MAPRRSTPSGILVVDKPEGLSSAQVVGRLKKLFGARKAGHAGTLDPFATGVLVCMFNQATRLGRFLLAGPKTYRAVLHLGLETDTQDGTGQVTDRQPLDADIENRLADVFRRFEGEIEQRPPIYSALKHQGTPLYKLARQGRPVQKPARRVHITALRITAVELPEVRFEVTCSAGTYIRSLCADIGRMLGCGGHLSGLQRTRSSGFSLDEAVSLEELERRVHQGAGKAALIAPATALRGMTTLVADGAAIIKINDGRRLTTADLPAPVPQAVSAGGNDDPHECKIVDAKQRLRAVVTYRPDKQAYDYCCVFPPADAN
jgi:tRNA pseudouridine55 synthase